MSPDSGRRRAGASERLFARASLTRADRLSREWRSAPREWFPLCRSFLLLRFLALDSSDVFECFEVS